MPQTSPSSLYDERIDVLREELIDPKVARATARQRRSGELLVSVPKAMVPEFLEDGWQIVKELKHKATLTKPKSEDVLLEDRIWTLLARLGFHTLSKNRRFLIPYSRADAKLVQQVDVFAADSEIALIVECKASRSGQKKSSFKKEIEAFGGRKEGIIRSVKQLLRKPDVKVVFLLATHDYTISDIDQGRLNDFDIQHFDNEALEYYEELQKHLGTAARFQLEANILPGKSIPAIDNTVPALQGKMGGHTYYSFLIEPEKLLKLGYVLHRSKANKRLMPTYQRLIKKARLTNVRRFVEGGGFFPNSIIANIESKRSLRFERAPKQLQSANSSAGLLHLPNTYRSIFIIDGQHRLYGYSDTVYSESTMLPVVAFVNLNRSEQVRIFMEINENQKAVPKNLRHTLNADLHWDSDHNVRRTNALKLQIAQDLGEDRVSPLYDRVIVGENVRAAHRLVTLEAIKQGLDRSNFFGEFSASAIKKDGTFYRGSNDETYKVLFPFLVAAFRYLSELCPEEWQAVSDENRLLVTNSGITSHIRLFSDIVDHLVAARRINPKSDKTEAVIAECAPYIDPLSHFYAELSSDERANIRRGYGSGGPIRFWRILQRAVSQARSDFAPQGLEEFWRDESHQFNTEAFQLIRDIEEFLREDFRRLLKAKYGYNWFKLGVHPTVYKESMALAAEKNREILEDGKEKDGWDCLSIVDYRTIALYGDNWSSLFESRYTRPGEEKMRGGKNGKTEWLARLNRIRNQNFHEYSVKEDEYAFLKDIRNWLYDLD